MRLRSRRARAGLGLIAIAVLLVVVGHERPSLLPGESSQVRVVFDDAAGLAGIRTAVRMAGVPVGEVVDVERAGDDAVVTLEIEPAAAGDLRRDARAELRPRLPLEGSNFIELEPGSPAAPPLGERVIPRSRTRNAVALYAALRFARTPTRQATREVVADLERVLEPAAQDGFQRALRSLPALTRDLALGAAAARGPHGHELAGVVQGASRTFDAVAREERSLLPLLQGSERSLRALHVDNGVPLDRTLATLPRALRALDTGGRALTGVLDRLDPLAEELQPGLRELPAALTDLRPLLRESRPALTRTLPLLRELRRALTAGRAAARPARDLFTALQPTITLLDESLLPALGRETEIGIPAYLSLINALQGGAGAFRAFQSEEHGPGRQGDGHFVRFEGRFYTGLGQPAPPCSLLEQANPQLAEQLAAQGVCVP